MERQQLENECNGGQEDALAEESRYHVLQSLLSITEARAQRVRQEERFGRVSALSGRFSRRPGHWRRHPSTSVLRRKQASVGDGTEREGSEESAALLSRRRSAPLVLCAANGSARAVGRALLTDQPAHEFPVGRHWLVTRPTNASGYQLLRRVLSFPRDLTSCGPCTRRTLAPSAIAPEETKLRASPGIHIESFCRRTDGRRWEKGEGRLLPEFQCYRDLYEHKLRQQEALSKQLRRQQRSIKEKEAGCTVQRKMFAGLHALLRCKADLALHKRTVGAGVDGGGMFGGVGGAGEGGRRGSTGAGSGRHRGGRGFAGAGGGVDEAYLKAIDAQAGIGISGARVGGAPDIMTLDDRD